MEVEETAELVDRFGWTTRSDGGRVSAHATLDLELKIWITLLTETNYGYQIRRDTDRFWFLRLTITSIRLADIRAALATIYLVQDCIKVGSNSPRPDASTVPSAGLDKSGVLLHGPMQ